MTLSEQVEYINKIKDRVLEYEEYEFVTRNQFYYVLFDLRTKLPLLEIRYGWKDFELQVFDFFDCSSFWNWSYWINGFALHRNWVAR